jgi:DNA/RNA endonuclease YhcR with UshA esterase domain
LDALEGRQVELRGTITVYEGRAEVIIHDSTQIRAVP